ncbi:hypothetical protein B0O79_0426 [Flavobacteriaceae bacterium MAR_2009_75]|nr:hypothetical protein B0O79_0426 [Flavobacteriaceae bacterium MAR_2009_75]
MNRVEKIVYDLVKKKPRIKFFLRNTYQTLCDFIPVKNEISRFPIEVREGFFFGFHDKCPFSADDTMLLGCMFSIPLRMPRSDDKLTIGYFNGDNYSSFNKFYETRSWNWHQGCQLQWRGSSNELVFNDFNGKINHGKVYNINTSEFRDLSRAISTVSSDGSWAAGYSFERIHRYMPGYGYPHGHRNDIDNVAPETDGLYSVDMETGKSSLIVSISRVASFEPNIEMMKGGKHFISHAIISPNSKRVMFLHRWVKNDLRHRWSRMFTCDKDGGNLYLFPTHEMVSHMAWKNDGKLLAYCRLKNEMEGYVLFEDQNITNYEFIGKNHFTSDGHPSFDKSDKWMITDTYPDRFRRQKLLLFDTKSNQVEELALLKHYKKYSQSTELNARLSCDLHPRWNREGSIVCFDSVHTGKRSLCTMNIKQITHGDD